MCQINNRNIGDKKITYHLYFFSTFDSNYP